MRTRCILAPSGESSSVGWVDSGRRYRRLLCRTRPIGRRCSQAPPLYGNYYLSGPRQKRKAGYDDVVLIKMR